MELRQLGYVVAVAEEASFTRAAQREHVAQPGVSAMIRRLEAELGQPLFDRSDRRVRLTGAGAAFLPHARAALAAAARARNAVDEVAGLLRGHIAIGAVPAGGIDLPGLLAAFHGLHPGVTMTLTEATADELVGHVRSGSLDLAIVGRPIRGAPPGLATATVSEQPLVAAVRPDHPLAARPYVALATLAEHPLVSLPRGTGTREILGRALDAAGLKARVAYEAGDPRLIADLAAAGLGVAILLESFAATRTADLRAVTITRPRLRGRLELVWRDGDTQDPAARAFLAAARERLGVASP